MGRKPAARHTARVLPAPPPGAVGPLKVNVTQQARRARHTRTLEDGVPNQPAARMIAGELAARLDVLGTPYPALGWGVVAKDPAQRVPLRIKLSLAVTESAYAIWVFTNGFYLNVFLLETYATCPMP